MTESLGLMTGPLESEDTFSLVVIRSAGSVLLGRKTRGYGTGKLVLPGGSDHYYLSSQGIGLVEGGHNASREVQEETGLTIDSSQIVQKGVLYIATEEDSKDVVIYETYADRIEPTSSAELESVAWFEETTLPYEEMPADYALWLPSLLTGCVITGFLETDHDEIVAGNIFIQQTNPLGRLQKLP